MIHDLFRVCHLSGVLRVEAYFGLKNVAILTPSEFGSLYDSERSKYMSMSLFYLYSKRQNARSAMAAFFIAPFSVIDDLHGYLEETVGGSDKPKG
jgi:hypothetical protein